MVKSATFISAPIGQCS